MMGREVRRVPADWVHPIYTEATAPYARAVGRHIPMHEGAWYKDAVKDYEEAVARDGQGSADEDYGGRPSLEDYMPDWPEEQRTHYMMYEDTSEGTPISPAFATPEELARWLADTGASAFADQTASYEGWLRVANGGFAPSAVLSSNGMQSGVEALASE